MTNHATDTARCLLLSVETDFSSSMVSSDVRACAAKLLQYTKSNHVAILGAIAASWSAYQLWSYKELYDASGISFSISILHFRVLSG